MCAMPSESKAKKMLRQRRFTSGLSMKTAEEACSHLETADERKACAFDVVATQNVGMAIVW